MGEQLLQTEDPAITRLNDLYGPNGWSFTPDGRSGALVHVRYRGENLGMMTPEAIKRYVHEPSPEYKREGWPTATIGAGAAKAAELMDKTNEEAA